MQYKFDREDDFNCTILKVEQRENATLKFPETIGDMRVTKIGPYACYGAAYSTVELPDTVTEIGEAAFEKSALSEIILPENLTTIEAHAFAGTRLKTIRIPKNVTDINSTAFAGCENLQTIEVDEENARFSSVNGLLCSKDKADLLVIPGALSTVTVPEGVTYIWSSAAARHPNLQKITFPDSLTDICNAAFAGATRLKQLILPENLTTIEAHAFFQCRELKSVKFPDKFDTIGRFAFAGCKSLTEITFPEGLTHIGVRAFAACKNLKNVTFSGDVCNIDAEAFMLCRNLKPPMLPKDFVCGERIFLGTALEKGPFTPYTTHFFCGTCDADINTDGHEYTFTDPEKLAEFYDYADGDPGNASRVVNLKLDWLWCPYTGENPITIDAGESDDGWFDDCDFLGCALDIRNGHHTLKNTEIYLADGYNYDDENPDNLPDFNETGPGLKVYEVPFFVPDDAADEDEGESDNARTMSLDDFFNI